MAPLRPVFFLYPHLGVCTSSSTNSIKEWDFSKVQKVTKQKGGGVNGDRIGIQTFRSARPGMLYANTYEKVEKGFF